MQATYRARQIPIQELTFHKQSCNAPWGYSPVSQVIAHLKGLNLFLNLLQQLYCTSTPYLLIVETLQRHR